MQKTVRNAVFPLNRNNFQQRMNICPTRYRKQNIVRVFASVKYAHIVKIEINNMYLRMILPNIVTQLVNIIAPATVHKH